MSVDNVDMSNPEYKGTTKAWWIVSLNVVTLLGQLRYLRSEYTNFRSRESWKSYFSGQNCIDLLAIFCSLVYCSLRIAYPSGANIADFAETSKAFEIELWMPALSMVQLLLVFLQFLFLLTTFDTFSKWISLFFKGLVDAGGFLSLFCLVICEFFYLFRV